MKYNNIILKRGLNVNSSVRKWIEKCFKEFIFVPITITIQLLNEKGASSMTWVAHNARPVKWELSSFDAMNNEIVLESLEITFDYLDKFSHT